MPSTSYKKFFETIDLIGRFISGRLYFRAGKKNIQIILELLYRA
jgi:hypothetical protein